LALVGGIAGAAQAQWWGGGGTVASSAMNGMASVISAQGNYNLATSAAAENLQQARSMALQNDLQGTNTYFEMRAMNRQYTAAERGPTPSMEQLARIAREQAPKPFSANDWDPITGAVVWPPMLQIDRYASYRDVLNPLVANQAQHGSLSFPDQIKARDTIEQMFGAMKSQIRDVPPQQYTECRSFLRSMIYDLSQSDLQ